MRSHTQSMAGEGEVALKLTPPAGSDLAPIELEPTDGPAVIGRSSRCRISLRNSAIERDDLVLSREHAVVERMGGRWLIRDISRHGTFLNGVRLRRDETATLRSGDLLRLGGWSFEVSIDGEETRSGASSIATIDRSADTSRVRRLRGEDVGNLAQHRLNLLLECAEQTADVTDETALSPIIIDAAMRGTGLARAAMLRPAGATRELVVLARRNLEANASISRSLVQAALDGDVAVLTPETSAEYGVSIAELGIQQALCAPVIIDGAVDSLLYLDSRAGDPPAAPDAVAFCHGLCRIAGLARGNLQRQRMRREHEVMAQELKAAQIIQAHLLPPGEGVVSGVRYAMRLLPGRQIAGDLFDVIRVSDSAAAVCLGDVTGGGAGPGLVMAVTLAHLRASLARPAELERAVSSLNRYLCERTPSNVFVSLWIGILDNGRQCVRWIDAGHGHWLHWRHEAALPVPRDTSTMPLGIDESMQYTALETPLLIGDRLILYSDGVSECHRRREGSLELFGKERVHSALSGSSTVADDVERIFRAIQGFCGDHGLADDTTAASVELST